MMVYSYTPLVRLADMAFPKYLADVKKEFPNVSFPTQLEESQFAAFGYAAVHDVVVPTGDVVTPGVPALGEDGLYYWTWHTRDFTPEEVAQNLANAKGGLKYTAAEVIALDLENGIPYPSGSQTFQARIKSSDITTLLAIKNIVEADNDPNAVYPFRFLDGYRADFTGTEFKQMVIDITKKQYQVIQAYWTYINTVEATTVITDLQDVPLTFIE